MVARCILVCLLAVSFRSQAEDITLSKDGRTDYVVVIPTHPSPEEITAAEWLSIGLKQVTKVDFNIITEDDPAATATSIYVGRTRAAISAGFNKDQMKPEEWHVRIVPPSVILAGGPPRGTIYSVTEFLEKEVGILVLDPFTEIVPERPTLRLSPIERTGRPVFPVRQIFTGFPYSYPAQDGRLIEKFRVWNKNTIDGREAVGGHSRMIPTGVHSFGNFISSREFASTHPEYFGMDSTGKRITDDMGTPSAWTQLCMSNTDVRRIVLERARKFLQEDQAAARAEGRLPAEWLVLSQNDNTANLCLCPDCKAVMEREGSESGPLIEFVNNVASGLKEEFPNVLVQTEAYNFTLNPPRTVRPESNVVVRYCDNYGISDLTHPLGHSRNYRPMSVFAGWQQRKCRLGVWDYWRVFQQHPPGFFAPSTNVRAISEDIKMFQNSGVELVTIEIEDIFGAGINAEPVSVDLQSFMPLRTWVGSKLIDDPAKNPELLVEAFCDGYYGPAAEPMQQLLQRIEQRQADLSLRVVDVQRQVWAEAFCDSEFLQDAYRWLDEAMRLTSDDPIRQTHIRRERIVIDSVFLWLESHLRAGHPEEAQRFPTREQILRRHREDWELYIATVFNEEGQKLAWPFIENGLRLLDKLKLEDTEFEHRPVGITDADVTLDGELNEAFWELSKPSRLVPRDPGQANDNPTTIRLAWSTEALYVGIKQPAHLASASLGVTLMGADRKGIQLSLYGARNNGSQALNAYFYDYDENGGLRAVQDRKAHSQSMGHVTDTSVTSELRFLWSDIDVTFGPQVEGAFRHDFLFNVESYALPESKVPSHVSSPWLIGTSPSWHSGYYKRLRIEQGSKP